MTTVKITELPTLSDLDANTSNTLLVAVDVPTTTTGKVTLTTIARELYSNNTLAVGNNYTILPNVVGQFTGNSTNYIQLNLQNLRGNGSGDVVVTADTGTDSDYFIDMGFNGSTYNYPGFTFAKPLDGYLVVQGSNTSPAAIGGNLIVGTTTAGKDITFTQGAFDETGQVAKFIYGTGFKLLKKPLIFADGTSQNSAVDFATVNSRITSNVSTLNASIAANVVILRGEITGNISTQNTFTQAAFNKANNALANTNGVKTAGTLEITDRLTVNGSTVMANVNFASNEAALSIIAGPYQYRQTPSNDGYMLHISGKQNTPSRVVFDSFGSGAYGIIAGRSARGTAQAPAATQNNDVLMRMTGNGWGTTGFAPLGVARIDIVATENYTDSARGSKIVFYNIEPGTNTVNEIASFNATTIDFTGTIAPLKGFVYTPRSFAASQTAITIDFANNVVLKANCAADITFSFANYTAGKQVEVWLTNTSGLSRTVTHGCLAINSTTNATTFTIPSTSTAWLKYYCVDGDQANTFVTVNHS
jgi:hypothetical protein